MVSWCWWILSFTHAKEYNNLRYWCSAGAGEFSHLHMPRSIINQEESVMILVFSWCWWILSFTHAKEYNKLRGKCDNTGVQLVLVHSLIYTCQRVFINQEESVMILVFSWCWCSLSFTHAKEYFKPRGKCDDTGVQLVLVHSLVYCTVNTVRNCIYLWEKMWQFWWVVYIVNTLHT